MKKLLSSLLIAIFAAVVAFTPAYADDACRNLVSSQLYASDFGLGENNTLSNLQIDNKTTFSLVVQVRLSDGTYKNIFRKSITSPGNYSMSFTVPEDTGNSHFVVKHNGTTKDIQLLTGLNQILSNGETYTLSFDVLSADPTTVGGIQIKDVQIERGSTATTYQPYNPLCATCDGTVVVENGESRCVPSIKIATTAYNAARFNPVKTDLDSAVATIRDIVTKTINQTAAIASLQADKQTRPEEQCPAGKKCLLVETEENGVIVPHWYPIIEDVD